jgi:hypothetical protein
MSNSKELELIQKLYRAGVINQDEIKKAELYLDLSTKTFHTDDEAITWLIQNRAVSRDRQDQVKAAFEHYTQSAMTPAEIEVTTPDKSIEDVSRIASTSQQSVSVNDPQPIEQPDLAVAKAVDQRHAPEQSAALAEMYRFNADQLTQLMGEKKVSESQRQQALEKLASCYYTFYHRDDLQEWIDSDYQLPLDIVTQQAHKKTLLQFYALVKQNIISESEYVYSIEDWSEQINDQTLDFSDERALFRWLADNDLLDHGITDAGHAQNYHLNLQSLNRLLEQDLINPATYWNVASELEEEVNADLRFTHQQPLLAWIEQNALSVTEPVKKKQKKKKSPLGCLFNLLWLYILYVIVSSVFSDEKKAVSPEKPAVSSQINCSSSQLLALLQRKLILNDQTAHLGLLQTLSKQRSIGNDRCRATAVFQSGTASLTFRAVTDKKRQVIDIADIHYSDIQLINTGNIQNDDAPRNNYETVIRQNIQRIDKMISDSKPNQLLLSEIITGAKSNGACKKQANDIVCPFTIFYTAANYQGSFPLEVEFTLINDRLTLKSITDFLTHIMEKMNADYSQNRPSR